MANQLPTRYEMLDGTVLELRQVVGEAGRFDLWRLNVPTHYDWLTGPKHNNPDGTQNHCITWGATISRQAMREWIAKDQDHRALVAAATVGGINGPHTATVAEPNPEPMAYVAMAVCMQPRGAWAKTLRRFGTKEAAVAYANKATPTWPFGICTNRAVTVMARQGNNRETVYERRVG